MPERLVVDRIEMESAVVAGPMPGPFSDLFVGGRLLQFRAGAVLFGEGDTPARVALLRSGRVKVSKFANNGHEAVLGFRGAGELLGELSAIDGGTYLATITAVEDGEMETVPTAAFVASLQERPDLAIELLRCIIGRVRDVETKRAEFGSFDATRRVARQLVELTERFGEPCWEGLQIPIPLSQQDLAGMVGTSREAVNKVLRRLRDKGLISLERRHVVVRDLDSLRLLGD